MGDGSMSNLGGGWGAWAPGRLKPEASEEILAESDLTIDALNTAKY